MLGYSGATGLWGFSLISTLLDAGRICDPAAKWIALLAASCVPLMLKKRLFVQCGLIAFVFLSLSPGFGLQYLAWTVPWTVMLQRRTMIAYHLIATAFALSVYAAGSRNTAQGVYVDLLNPAHFPVLILMGIVCWTAIAVITWQWARLHVDTGTPWEDRNPALPARLGDSGSAAAAPDC